VRKGAGRGVISEARPPEPTHPAGQVKKHVKQQDAPGFTVSMEVRARHAHRGRGTEWGLPAGLWGAGQREAGLSPAAGKLPAPGNRSDSQSLAATHPTPPHPQAPVHYSNVMVLDPITNRPVRTCWMYDLEGGQKVRQTRGKGASRSIIYPPAPHKIHPGPDTRGGCGLEAKARGRGGAGLGRAPGLTGEPLPGRPPSIGARASPVAWSPEGPPRARRPPGRRGPARARRPQSDPSCMPAGRP
jgi:hypothetical protein